MTVHVVSLKQFIGHLGKLPDQLEDAIVRGLRSAALRGVSVCVEKINTTNPDNGTPPPVDEGTLMRSIKYERLVNGGSVVADAPHAPYLEMGTRPHRPPLQPLIEWAQRKFGVEEDEAKRIAWAVASKIAKVGTEPRLYMARTVDDLEGSIVLQEIEAELKKLP